MLSLTILGWCEARRAVHSKLDSLGRGGLYLAARGHDQHEPTSKPNPFGILTPPSHQSFIIHFVSGLLGALRSSQKLSTTGIGLGVQYINKLVVSEGSAISNPQWRGFKLQLLRAFCSVQLQSTHTVPSFRWPLCGSDHTDTTAGVSTLQLYLSSSLFTSVVMP